MNMKRAILERNFVVVLFVLVIVIFSFAERDTQKLIEKYNAVNIVEVNINTAKTDFTAENFSRQPALPHKITRN